MGYLRRISSCTTKLYSDQNIQTLESFQRRALAIVDYDLSYKEALAKYELETLKDRREIYVETSTKACSTLPQVVPPSTKQ